MTVNVALVDDHLVFREAFRALLAATSEFSVVAEATEGREVCALFEASKPDVVVMDVTLPGTDGLSATRELTSRHPGAKIMMLSAHAVHDYVTRAFTAGAAGYALKSQPAAAVIAGLRAVARGDRYLAPELPSSLLASGRSRRKGAPGQLDGLSNREREIFDLVVRGLLQRRYFRRALDQRQDGRDPSGEHQSQARRALQHPAAQVRGTSGARLRVRALRSRVPVVFHRRAAQDGCVLAHERGLLGLRGGQDARRGARVSGHRSTPSSARAPARPSLGPSGSIGTTYLVSARAFRSSG